MYYGVREITKIDTFAASCLRRPADSFLTILGIFRSNYRYFKRMRIGRATPSPLGRM